MRYNCENCGCELNARDYVWYDNDKSVCPLCGGEYAPLHKIPDYETIAQWETRTGREYPDTAPVYFRHIKMQGWQCGTYQKAHSLTGTTKIVATEAGAPPDDLRFK